MYHTYFPALPLEQVSTKLVALSDKERIIILICMKSANVHQIVNAVKKVFPDISSMRVCELITNLHLEGWLCQEEFYNGKYALMGDGTKSRRM